MTRPAFSTDLPKTDYGIPALTKMRSQLARELHLVKVPELTDDPGLHMLRAAMLMFPTSVFRPCAWDLWAFRSLFDHDWVCWWGPAAVGKTRRAAVATFVWWIADPENTYAPCCSTTAGQLDKRVWGDLSTLFHAFIAQEQFKDFPAKIVASSREIRYTGNGEDPKAIIRGVAIQQGTMEEALGNVIGIHKPRVLLVVDEAQASREALIEARINLFSGTKRSKIIMLGNPTSRTDPLGKYSVPDHPDGWKHVEQFEEFTWTHTRRDKSTIPVVMKRPKHIEWTTPFGAVLVFCGFDSPGLLDPETYSYFITAKHIDETLRQKPPDHPLVWTFIVGFMCPNDPSLLLFNPVLFTAKNANYRGTTWATEPLRLASLDPNFSAGGDEYILRPLKAGMTVDDRFMIESGDVIRVPYTVDRQPEESLEEARQRYVANLIKQLRTHPTAIVYDASASHKLEYRLIESHLKEPGSIMGIEGQEAASVSTPSINEPKPASELYANLRAEMYHLLWFFLQSGQFRGITDADMDELAEIRGKRGARGTNTTKIVLESKAEMRERGVKSPNLADSLAMAAYLLRHRFNCVPGANVPITLPAASSGKKTVAEPWDVRYLHAAGLKAGNLPLAGYRRTR